MNTKLKYITPAKSFTEALPTGKWKFGSHGLWRCSGRRAGSMMILLVRNRETTEKEIDAEDIGIQKDLLFEEKFWGSE